MLKAGKVATVRHWHRTVVIDIVLYCNLSSIENNVFLFLLSPAELKSDVLSNWQCAADCLQHFKFGIIYSTNIL